MGDQFRQDLRVGIRPISSGQKETGGVFHVVLVEPIYYSSGSSLEPETQSPAP